MKKYVYVRTFEAELTTKLGYCNKRGWDVPDDQDPYEDGYHCYDGGYETWISKEEFDQHAREAEEIDK